MDTEQGKVPDCLDSPRPPSYLWCNCNLDRNGQHANLHVIFFHLLQKVVRMVDRIPLRLVYRPKSGLHQKQPISSRNASDRSAKVPPKLPTQKKSLMCISVNPRKCSQNLNERTSTLPYVPEIFTYDKFLLSVKRQYLFPWYRRRDKTFASLLQQQTFDEVPRQSAQKWLSYNLSTVSFGSQPFLLFIQVIRLTKNTFFRNYRMIHTILHRCYSPANVDNGMWRKLPPSGISNCRSQEDA